MESAIVVADTSVLVNFLRIDRMDLIGRHPQRFLATDHVDAEITNHYPDQRARYQSAVASRLLETCSVVDAEEVELFLRLRPGERWEQENVPRSRLRSTESIRLPLTTTGR